MDGVAESTGVYTPVGKLRDHDPDPFLYPGALFADDAVGLTADVEATVIFCAHVTAWCTENEMSVGIKKCGIMEFPPNLEDDDPPLLSDDHPLRASLKLQDQMVPLVTEYKYLGLRLTPSLTINDLVESRFRLGKITVATLAPFLRSPCLPMFMRWQVFRAVVLPRLLFGAEVYGMNRKLTDRVQSMVSNALIEIAGLARTRRDLIPSAPLWHSFKVKPVCALAAGRRARAFRKCFDLKTQPKRLVERLLETNYWTWSSGVPRWIHKWARPYWNEGMKTVGGNPYRDPNGIASTVTPDNWQSLTAEDIRKVVERCIYVREKRIREKDTRPRSKETVAYFQGGYYGSRPRLTHPRVFSKPEETRGMQEILKYRIGAVDLAPRLAKGPDGRIDPKYIRICPFCERNEPETAYHVIFECAAWNRARRDSGILGTISDVESLWEKRREARSRRDRDRFRRLGISGRSFQAIGLVWALGGAHSEEWRLQGFYPDAPKQSDAESVADFSVASLGSDTSASDSEDEAGSLSSSSSTGTESGNSDGETAMDDPHLYRMGRFLLRVRALRAQILKRLARQWEAHNPPPAVIATTGTAEGQSPNG